MKCPLNEKVACDLEDVFGACFFCQKVNEGYAVSKIPILETELVSYKGEGI